MFGRWDLAAPLLASLAETTEEFEEVAEYHVIDDGSLPPLDRELATLRPPFLVTRNPQNLGFATTVNEAVARASGELVCLLNSDIVLSSGWLEPMLEAMQRFPEAFAVGNIQLSTSDRAVDHAGIIFYNEGYPLHFRASHEFLTSRRFREMPAVTAACTLIRRNRFLALGGFDRSYRNGFEDVDLCLRARMRGWPSFVANGSCVGHHISASPGRKDHEDANARLFLERWRPLTAVWQRDWENRLLRERREHVGEIAANKVPRRTGAPQQPRRVLVDLARLGPGGTNGGIKVLVRELLLELRHQAPDEFVFLLVIPSSVEREAVSWIGPGDELWILPDTGPSAPPTVDSRVHRLSPADSSLARLLDADVIYCPLGVSDYLTPDVPAIALAVDLLHREHPECLSPRDIAVREMWYDRMVRTSFRIQCNSHWVADRVIHHFNATNDQLFVVHNAVHKRLGDIPGRPSKARRTFLYPANAWRHKNHDTLLVAYRHYLTSAVTERWSLTLTGHRDESMNRVEAHARALGIGDELNITGFVDQEELLQIWSRTGALVFPSLHEGFGIPLLEAMHFGVPVVAGKQASIPEIAGDACLYADVRDPRALGSAMTEIHKNAMLREELIARGRHRAQKFSLQAEVTKLHVALREAVDQFRRAGINWRQEEPR